MAFCFLGLRSGTWQWWVTATFHLPAAILSLPLGLAAARREAAPLMLILLSTATAQPPLYAVQLLSRLPATANVTAAHETALDASVLLAAPPLPPLSPSTLLLLPSPPSSPSPLSAGYCTLRLRDHVFPFSVPGLNLLYALAIVVRLLLVTAGVRAWRNFGTGLRWRVH